MTRHPGGLFFVSLAKAMKDLKIPPTEFERDLLRELGSTKEQTQEQQLYHEDEAVPGCYRTPPARQG